MKVRTNRINVGGSISPTIICAGITSQSKWAAIRANAEEHFFAISLLSFAVAPFELFLQVAGAREPPSVRRGGFALPRAGDKSSPGGACGSCETSDPRPLVLAEPCAIINTEWRSRYVRGCSAAERVVRRSFRMSEEQGPQGQTRRWRLFLFTGCSCPPSTAWDATLIRQRY